MQPDSSDLYDALAPHYEEYSRNYGPYLQAIEDLTISELATGMRILDVGTGDGRRLKKIMDKVPGLDCTAIEPSAKMAEICRQNIGSQVYVNTVEEIDSLEIGQFDLVISLWNVLGHVPVEHRLTALQIMVERLKAKGKILLDLNNRHNAASYGYLEVFKRYWIDLLNFDTSRGDANYNWKIGDQEYRGYGHLFMPAEAEGLFSRAGLKVNKRLTVNYRTGKTSSSRFLGQLFYILEKA